MMKSNMVRIITQQHIMWNIVWCDSVANGVPAYTMIEGIYVPVDETTALPCFAWVDEEAVAETGYRLAGDVERKAPLPTIDWGVAKQLSVYENVSSGTLVGRIGTGQPGIVYESDDLDQTVFDFDPISGEIHVGAGAHIDYETRPVYEFAVRTSWKGMDYPDEVTYTIQVLDVREAPTIEWSDVVLSVEENAPPGTYIGKVGTWHSVDITTNMVVYESNVFDGMPFDLDPISGDIRVGVGARIDFEMQSIYQFTVSASWNGTVCSTMDFMIHVEDVNEFPMILNESISYVSMECVYDALPGTEVGYVEGFDIDMGPPVSFSISRGSGVGYFGVDSATGMVTVLKSLFGLHGRTCDIDTVVTDGSGLISTKKFVIRLIDR